MPRNWKATAFGLTVATAAAPAFGQINVLASFNGSNGQNPEGNLTLSGDTLYGTTYDGGTNGYGTVFSLPISGGTPTVLASFNGTNGQNPYEGGVTLSGTTLYGTTRSGGANGYGEVFSLPMTGGTPTVLASFNAYNGAYPCGGVLTASGNTLYGTTANGSYGYANSDGEVFSLPITGGTPTVLASFNGSNGNSPLAALTLSGNTLYGTTYYGGSGNSGYGYGEVFSLPINGGTPTVLASFNGSNGGEPCAELTLTGNTLYGTTYGGGANGYGEVFSLPTIGGTPTVLASFDGSNGSGPFAGLTLSGSTLYGTTYEGGDNGDGEVFSLPTTGGTPTVLASFDGSNGKWPYADLTLSGNTLYGTTYYGGANGVGTVFCVTVPEPASISILAMGAVLVLRRRRAGYPR